MILTKEEDETRNRKLEFARQLRRHATKSEKLLWLAIRRKNRIPQLGHRFYRQKVLYGFIADFYCASKELVIEIDGPSHIDKAWRDKRRDDILAEHGIRTLRFSTDQIFQNLPDVLLKIRYLFGANYRTSIAKKRCFADLAQNFKATW